MNGLDTNVVSETMKPDPTTVCQFDYERKGFQSRYAWIYQHKEHVVNTFVWPTAQSNSNPRARSLYGFNMVHWQRDGMTFWLVSDISADELLEFAQIMRAVSEKETTKPD